ncbi:RHS repeat-associated core domain-containing protein [Pseudoxanthomonas sp. UTMC 1351]|uniref:RHS repeat-associated core domain-containing protein n=1 Tax=Pseudoxanthomonas sp. UTMC 1351 TaxID=2695853 RepID=UPI0034CF15BF
MTSSGFCIGRWRIALALLLIPLWASAQVVYPLGSSGSMGLGSPNGEFTVAQDDLRVKVPGGYVRVNRDFDGTQWVFNRQWSGLGNPSYYQGSYRSIGSFFTCTIVDGISSCDTTASGSVAAGYSMQPIVHGVRVPNDPNFGREADGRPKLQSSIEAVARKGVGFSRSSDGTSYFSSKHPRFLVRLRQVPVLAASTGPDAHPSAGKPGQGGAATTLIEGYRWVDRSGEWIEYDNFGRISSYGDRNDVRVWFQYGRHGQIERVLDDNGRTVFTFLYKDDGQFITEVRDHTPIDGVIRRVQYHYTDNGYLSRVVDARGGETRFEYGRSTGSMLPGGNELPGSGNPVYSITKVTDAEGRELKVEFGATERISKITAPDGGKTEIEYAYDKLKKEFSTTVKYPETSSGRRVETRRYDAEGRLVYRDVNGKTLLTAQGGGSSMSYTDERGSTVTVNRDNFDAVTRKTNSDGTTISYTYDSGSLDLKEAIDEAGVATRLNYDAKGNLTKLQAATGKPEEQVTEYEVNARGEAEVVRRKGGQNSDGSTSQDAEIGLSYDANGNVSELVDGEGKTWEYEYDSLGNLVRALNPLNHEWRYTYDAHGNRLTATDPNDLVTRYTYDSTDRLLTVTDPREKIYRLEYDAAGRPQKVIDPTGAALTQEYDPAGRVISSYDSLNQKVQIAYDATDRVVAVTDGQDNITRFDYSDIDGTDRGSDLVSRINYPTLQRLLRYNSRQGVTQMVEAVDGDTRTTTATYDPRGAVTSTVNAYTKTQSAKYDAFGRPTTGTNELGHTVSLAYDHRGNLISATDELGHTVRLEFDRRDKLVKETNAEGESTSYRYDDAGRLQELQRPNGTRLTFEFDSGGRLQTRKSYRADGSLELSDGFTWDDGNRLTGWTTNAASSTSTYDDANRLLGETVTIDGVALTRSYTYHPNGQVKTYTGPDGATITYSYDGNGDLSRVDIPGEGSMSVTERQWTEARKVVLPGGTVQEIERNGLLSPTQLRVKRANQVVVFDQQSSYGKLEELVSRTTQGHEIDYTYDDAMRLREADPASGATEAFVLDAAGNRLSDNVVTDTWQYDDANRLIQRGNVSYQYDAAGNLIRKTDASAAEPRRTTHYAYDGYNRLVEVRDGADQVVSRYAYNPFGYRLSKEVTTIGATNSGAIAGKRLFLQAEEGLLAEIAATGAVLQTYGWQPDRSYSTSPLFTRVSGTYYYYQNDPLGQPRQLIDRSGNVAWSATRISAFGEVTTASGTAVEQPWRFPGQYYDAETGLHYNVHRYYDADVGRYITADPIGLTGGLNFYVYGNAMPTGLVDPYGLWVEFPNTGSWLADATFGSVYWVTNGWSPSDALVNGVAGYGDTLSFGGSRLIREWADIGDVDYCSTAYAVGEGAGLVHSLAFGGAHLGRNALNQMGKKGLTQGLDRLFSDPRTWGSVRDTWSLAAGNGSRWLQANGQSLHHWLVPQRWGSVNAGFNYLPISAKFNSWMNNSTATRSFVEWGFRASVLGIYGALPTTIGTKMTDYGPSGDCEC